MKEKEEIIFYGEETQMTKEELKSFFSKYNVVELEAFNIIFEYNKDTDITGVLNIYRKIYNKKYEEVSNDYDGISRHYPFTVLDLMYKQELLNDKELLFLKELVEPASMYLDTMNTIYNDYNGSKEELGFTPTKEIDEISKLEVSIENEMLKRKNYQKTKQKED